MVAIHPPQHHQFTMELLYGMNYKRASSRDVRKLLIHARKMYALICLFQMLSQRTRNFVLFLIFFIRFLCLSLSPSPSFLCLSVSPVYTHTNTMHTVKNNYERILSTILYFIQKSVHFFYLMTTATTATAIKKFSFQFLCIFIFFLNL